MKHRNLVETINGVWKIFGAAVVYPSEYAAANALIDFVVGDKGDRKSYGEIVAGACSNTLRHAAQDNIKRIDRGE